MSDIVNLNCQIKQRLQTVRKDTFVQRAKTAINWVMVQQLFISCSDLGKKFSNSFKEALFIEVEEHPLRVKWIENEIKDDLADKEHGSSIGEMLKVEDGLN